MRAAKHHSEINWNDVVAAPHIDIDHNDAKTDNNDGDKTNIRGLPYR
jgi:hypothetical protein